MMGADFFTRRLDPYKEIRRLIAKLEALGHQVTLQPPDSRPENPAPLRSAGCCRAPGRGHSRISS
jgi:hypothetical protein